MKKSRKQQCVKEVERLRVMLEQVRNQMDMITKYYDLTEDKKSIEAAEIQKTIIMCENDYSVEDMLHWLNYTRKPRVEYTLAFNENSGRYWAGDYELTSGHALELYIEDGYDMGWNFGRVEHGSEGYYFWNVSGDEHHPLYEGAKVAIRR